MTENNDRTSESLDQDQTLYTCVQADLDLHSPQNPWLLTARYGLRKYTFRHRTLALLLLSPFIYTL